MVIIYARTMFNNNIINTIYTYVAYNTFTNVRKSYIEFYECSFNDVDNTIKLFINNNYTLYYYNTQIGQSVSKLKDINLTDTLYLKLCNNTKCIKIPFNLIYLRVVSSTCLIHDIINNHTITHLEFDWQFNQPINALANNHTITHLTFGDYFNQPIDALLNNNTITYLTFGWSFDQPIDTLLNNNTITHLTFGDYFYQPIDALLNNNTITHLKFGHYFNRSIDALNNNNTITHLTLPKRYKLHALRRNCKIKYI